MSKINPKWVSYNNLHNEGGEGYNPHAKYIGESSEPAWSKMMDRMHQLERIMDGTSVSDPQYADMASEVDKLRAAIKIDMEG